jgi:hypothetical protein
MLSWIFYTYLLSGVIFGFWFAGYGADKLDESAKGMSWKVRALIFPGSAALWPWLLVKCLKSLRS